MNNWHPYPKEKPVINGFYFITRRNGVRNYYWNKDRWQLTATCMAYVDEITAWQELPKPYKEER